MTKLLILIVLFLSFCSFTITKPLINLNERHTITQDTIPEVLISLTKKERYKLYLNDCNTVVQDTILQSGYLKFDTIRLQSIPENEIYLGKVIVKSIQVSNDFANIITRDTVWNEIGIPEYRSTYNYYVLAKHPLPIKKITEIDFWNKIMVSRLMAITWKKSKPLLYNDWEKYINNKSNRSSTTEQYF